MKVRIVDKRIANCGGFITEHYFINLIHRNIYVGVYLSVYEDGYVVSARVSCSRHLLLSAVHFPKDYFPSRMALYEYILTLAKIYGKN